MSVPKQVHDSSVCLQGIRLHRNSIEGRHESDSGIQAPLIPMCPLNVILDGVISGHGS